MKIVFLGTPDFAVASLKALADAGHEVMAVVTAPDRPAGRGQALQQSAVKRYALDAGIKVLQPTNLKDEDFLSQLKALKAQLQIVVAFRMLPVAVWDMPPLGTYNLHASLLPRYRGAAPINRAVMNGDTETGITTFKLKHAIDSGNILLQKRVEIGEEMDAGQLHDKLMAEGAKLLVQSVVLIETSAQNNQDPPFQEQDERVVTHAPKIFRDDCQLHWSKSAEHLFNQVRGLSPFPGAFTFIAGEQGKTEQLKIFKCKKSAGHEGDTNGSLLTDNTSFLKVRCSDGCLDLLEVQLEGKKRMHIAEFLRGYRITAGTLLK